MPESYDWTEDDTLTREEILAKFNAMKPLRTRGPRTEEELVEQTRQRMRERGWDLSATAIVKAETLISDGLPLDPQQADALADLLREMTTDGTGVSAGRHRHGS